MKRIQTIATVMVITTLTIMLSLTIKQNRELKQEVKTLEYDIKGWEMNYNESHQHFMILDKENKELERELNNIKGGN